MFTIRLATLPYYRLYHFSTRIPLNGIANLASEKPSDPRKIVRAISTWRTRKQTELQFILLACTVLAAAVIGAFSWTIIEESHWLTQGFWHASLILSILGILLCASESTVLHLLGPLPTPRGHAVNQRNAIARYTPLLLSPTTDPRGNYIPRKKMVFTWQCPMMFMSYSVCAFLAGLTVLVCAPLVINEGQWTVQSNIAIMYLAVTIVAGTIFVFSSFWVYHYIDLESFEDVTDVEYDEEDPPTGHEHGGEGNQMVRFLPSTLSASAAQHPHLRSDKSKPQSDNTIPR